MTRSAHQHSWRRQCGDTARTTLLLICALWPWGVRAQPMPADDAQVRAQTEALTQAYRRCCGNDAAAAHVCTPVDPYFDYRLLADDTLRPLRKSLTPRQQTRLGQALERIFAKTARQSGKAFCSVTPRIVSTQTQARGTQVQVEVTEPGEDVPTQFAFVWRRHKGTYRVVDLSVEGGSLITDYQNQFSRIHKKEGVSGLLRRVEARLVEPTE